MTALDQPLKSHAGVLEFGRFHIDLDARALRQEGAAVSVGSRAFDILAVLASAGGRLVTKDELLDAVWPETIVEENNIHVHLSALRKILGPDRTLIMTVPGRGYRLCAEVKTYGSRCPTNRPMMRASGCLPMPNTTLVGRETALEQIHAMLDGSRLVTLVGAGGIGKTRLAFEVARRMEEGTAKQQYIVELSTLKTQENVLDAMMRGLGQPKKGADLCVANVARALSDVDGLLIIDNAEHLVSHVAATVEALLAANERLRILVTSREPLRIAPESVFRVDPLEVPPADATDEETLAYPAVTLFRQRASAVQAAVDADAQHLRVVGEICRRLDGIPLAIELAAARVAVFGLEGVRQGLDDRMSLLTGGYRTALPRHQTLRSTFDWSHALLGNGERALFRRIAVFDGPFTFDAMAAVACDESLSPEHVRSDVGGLIAKSLLNVHWAGSQVLYQMYESTRAYALQRLQDEGEMSMIAARLERQKLACQGVVAKTDVRTSRENARRPSPATNHHAVVQAHLLGGDSALRKRADQSTVLPFDRSDSRIA